MATKLTSTQQDFIKQLFGPCMGNLKAAAKAVLGTENYEDLMTVELTDAIKKRADDELILNIPRAIFVVQQMLNDDPSNGFFSEKLHKVAVDLLDRAGLGRQERPNNAITAIGIVMLPNKQSLPEPPAQIELKSTSVMPV